MRGRRHTKILYPNFVDDPVELGRWLRAERLRAGLSAAQLAARAEDAAKASGEKISLKQQTVSLFENGRAKSIPRWIKFARMVIDATRPSSESEAVTGVADTDLVRVELLPTFAGAGGGVTGDGDHAVAAFSRYLVEHELRAKPNDLLAVLIEGDSMEPDFRSGDQILVDKRRRSLSQPGAFCLWDGDGFVIKLIEKIYDSEPPKVRVISRNTIYQATERLADEVDVLGRVVWFGRRV